MASESTRAGVVPWPDDVVADYVARGYWEERALGAHLRAVARNQPDTVALVDGDTHMSYADLLDAADGLATRLGALGLRRDDRIVVQLPNRWEFAVLIVACLRLGVIPVMALPAHREHEMTYLAEHAEAKAVVVPDVLKDFDHQAMARQIAEDLDCVEHVLVVGYHIQHGSVDLGPLCSPAEDPVAAARRLDADPPESRDVAVFLLSGGTTGLPKLIARTHNDYTYNGKGSAEVCGFDADTVYLAALPMGHNFPLACPGILGTWLCGGRVVLLASPDAATALAVVERERVTATAVVPAVAQRWLEYRDHSSEHDLSSLSLLQVGGARLADHIAYRIRPTLGATLQQVFGMAEGLLNYTRLDDPDDVICTTQGRPMCVDDELLVVDERGEPLPTGEAGVLLTRGPYTPRGYYRAAEHNARAFTSEGWYRTGDIVRLRGDGNLLVEGRDKDMINRGGENISAEEVENFAYQVDGISQAAAVAMFDPELGERVCLYVVPEPGATVELSDVHDVMRQAGAARFKLPERLVTVDSLSMTKIGKIDKKALREDVAQRVAQESAAPVAAE